ncbi:MAG TPA: glycoside hydrolase family 3 N-terminal domain-containing protein [Streptosporangiaceae bacterium]|nr:glycoside hydrolase family 3 N-terminal domain-containing protein [Streptosporangiaceae bacterium]
MHKQIWRRTGGVCAAAAVVLVFVFAANADAGPVAGVRSASRFTSQAPNAAASGKSIRKAAAAAQSPAALAATLTPAQLAGQRVIYSYSGLTPPSALLTLIRHGEVGGVIFFSSNFSNTAQFTAAVATLIANNSLAQNPAHNFPLLLMTDQEGGLVRRLPGAPVLSEKQIGSLPTPAQRAAAATAAGTGAGQNLLSFGLNMNLAPVLDVFRAPGNFDDRFQRSYSMNPVTVSRLGSLFITAQQATGVAATAKHFPGLGAATASQNTDLVPVTITLSKSTIQSVDEAPFAAAIAAGVKLVMVSWARYPNLGSSRPAGLSSVIVQGQLRRRLGFTGVTITDAIGAGALRNNGSIQNRSLLAAQAGMQLILTSSLTEAGQALAGLQTGFNNGSLSQSVFRANVAQILTLRGGLPDPSIGFGRA